MILEIDSNQTDAYFLVETKDCFTELVKNNPDVKRYKVCLDLCNREIEKYNEACEKKIEKMDADYLELTELQNTLVGM